MATLRELNIKLGADTTDLERKLKRASNQLRREGRNWSSLGNELSAAVTLPLLGVGAAAIKSAADFERMETSFSVMLGSAEKARELFAGLKEDAAATPFELTEISDSAKRLLAFGISGDKVRDTIQSLGDIAAGSGSNIAELARIFGQAKATGQVLTADLRELANRGIPIFDVLMKKFNMTGAELRKFVEGGNVSFEILEEALQSMTKEGGLFFQGMEKQSKTLAGQFSTFKDNVTASLAELGTSISDAFDLKNKMKSASDWLGDMVKRFEGLDAGTKKTIVTTGLLVAAVGPAIKVYGMLKNTIAGAVDIARAAVGGFKSMATGVLNAAAAFQKMDMVTKATTIGAIVVAVTAAVVVFRELNSQMSASERIQSSLADISKQVSTETGGQIAVVKALTEKLGDNNAKLDERQAALAKLNEIAPEYFGNLTVEKSSVEDIAAAYDNYSKSIIKAAEAKIAQSKVDELVAKRLDLEERLAGEKRAQETQPGFARHDVQVKRLQGELADLNAEIDAVTKRFIDATVAADHFKGSSSGSSKAPTSSGKAGTGPTTKATTAAAKEQKDVLGELATAYDLISAKSAVYGSEMDATAARSQALKAAIDDLLADGLSPTDPQVQMLAERYRNLNAELLPLTESYVNLKTPLMEVTTAMTEQAAAVAASFEGLRDTMGEAMQAAGQSMMDMAAQGEVSFKKLGKAALKGAADVVRAALMKAVASQIEKLLVSIPPPFNLAIAAAGGAAVGAMFNATLKGLKIPALAEGAMVTKPTLALIGEKGPEIVAPPQKLPGLATMMGMERRGGGGRLRGEFILRKGDLYLAVEEAVQAYERSTGSSFVFR